MSGAAHQNWQSLGAHGLQGTYTASGGTGFVVGRSELDSLRIGEGRTPEASYPDGYLGTIRSRRDDRLLDSLKARETQRPYQRGVHKGERIDPADYLWPRGLDPERGIRNQRKGMRTTPAMELVPTTTLVNDGKAMNQEPAYSQVDQLGQIDPVRAAQLRSLKPPWS